MTGSQLLNAASVSHDCQDLLSRLTVKNSWETRCPGRFDQARAALQFYQLRLSARESKETGTTYEVVNEDRAVEALGQALRKDKDSAMKRYNILRKLPQV